MEKGKTRIFFRADANATIGFGHVMRSLALADILKNEFDCFFVIRNPTSYVKHEIERTCKAICVLPDTLNMEEDLAELLRLVTKEDLVVLDGSHFKSNYQKNVKSNGNKLICIDDLNEGYFYADAVISRAFGATKEQFKAEPTTEFYLGPKYAMVRKEFLGQSSVNKSAPNSFFICFGGADKENCNLKILKSISGFNEISNISILLGDSNQHKEQLEEYIRGNDLVNKVHIYSKIGVKEVASIMRGSEYAVVPASGVLFEVMASGLKIISGYTTQDQYYNYKYLASHQLVLGLGNFNEVPEQEINGLISKLLSREIKIEPIDHSIFEKYTERFKQLFHKLSC